MRCCAPPPLRMSLQLSPACSISSAGCGFSGSRERGLEHDRLRDDAVFAIIGDGGRAIELVAIVERLRDALAEAPVVRPREKPVPQFLAHAFAPCAALSVQRPLS